MTEPKLNPCPYCESSHNDFVPINQTADYSKIEMAMSRLGVFRVRAYTSKGICIAQDSVDFKYCPNCGKKHWEANQ